MRGAPPGPRPLAVALTSQSLQVDCCPQSSEDRHCGAARSCSIPEVWECATNNRRTGRVSFLHLRELRNAWSVLAAFESDQGPNGKVRLRRLRRRGHLFAVTTLLGPPVKRRRSADRRPGCTFETLCRSCGSNRQPVEEVSRLEVGQCFTSSWKRTAKRSSRRRE